MTILKYKSDGEEEESQAKADDVDSEDEGGDQKGDSSIDKLAETLQKNPSVQVVAQVVKAFRYTFYGLQEIELQERVLKFWKK